jgi:hypothetical protein
MKHNKHELDAIIDNATRAIREEEADSSVISESATRVWARISQEAVENSQPGNLNTMNANNTTEHIHGCADFQSLIPAYLDGQLSAARTLLLEDHSNECIPCRRELKAQRAAATPATAGVRQPVSGITGGRIRAIANGWRLNHVARWGFAAALLVCMGLAGHVHV